jgi:SPP1 gp7 family putative phage head morphogenesis protein
VSRKSKRPSRRIGIIPEPRQIERRYQAALLAMVREIEAEVRATLIASLPDLAAQRNAIAPRADSWADDVERLINGLRAFGTRAADRMTNRLSEFSEGVNRFNRASFSRLMANVLGVDIMRGADGPWLDAAMKSWAAENASLIRSIPDQLVTQVEGITQRALRTGADPRVTASEIRQRFGVSEARARLIGRDQVAKLNGQITQGRNQALGLDTYVWSTSGDERVREAHKAMNGKLCKWDDPTVYSDDGGETWLLRSQIGGVDEHPGGDFQCRCVSQAVLPADFMAAYRG